MTLQLNLELDVPAETLEADVAAFEETRTAFEQHGDEVPSLADLVKFMSSGDADPDLVAEANERLAMTLGTSGADAHRWLPLHETLTALNSNAASQATPPISDEDQRDDPSPVPLHKVIATVNAVPRHRRPPNPLAPLVRAWIQRPYAVKPSRRISGQIIPAKLAQAEPRHDRRAGELFSLAAHRRSGQMVLPGFGVERRLPALPLALYELGGGTTNHSRAAALPLRMFIQSVLAVPQQDRGAGRPVALEEVTLREFLAWFWPNRRPTPDEYWPALVDAADQLFRLRIPLVDPETGRGHLRQMVNISGIPRGPDALDDTVRVVVDLPADSARGPQLSDNLRYWGNWSAPAYRALINLAYLWYEPGVTIHPVGRKRGGKGQFWVQSQDPGRYPELSDQDLIDVCFPVTETKNRRVLLQRSHRTIDKLEKAGELHIDGRHILPPVTSKPDPE